MTTPFAASEPSKPLWQVLLAPMLLASLALHGLVLMLPSGSSDEAVIPPPDPEQDSVAITRVPPAGAPDAAVAAPAPGAVMPGARPGAALSALRAVAPAQAQRVATGARPVPTAQPRAQRRSQPTQRSQPSTAPTQAPTPPASTSSTRSTPTAPQSSSGQPSRPLFEADLGEKLLAYVAGLNLPQGQVDRAVASVQNRFSYNPAAATPAALSTNQQQWEAAIRQETGLASLTPETDRTSFSTVYPQRVCLSNEPGEISIGALVNPDGTWRGEPTLLRSSGYGALDRKALQEIQSHRFAPADGVRAYVLSVGTSVNYGSRPCLAAKPQS